MLPLNESRLAIRLRYIRQRLRKSLRLAEVRYVRKNRVRWYYRHRDYAPPPSMITLRVTNQCNLRCTQCGQWGDNGVFHDRDRARTGDLTTAQWQRFLDQMSGTCPHVYFFGGEPMLRTDLLALVKHAAGRGMITGINTNGTFLRGRGAEIVEAGLDYILVSVDGPREVNNLIRIGTRDAFGLATAGVQELVEARKRRKDACPLIEVFMTLTTANQGEILSTAKIARELGADYFSLAAGMFTTPQLAAESERAYRAEFGVSPAFYRGFVRDVTGMQPQAILRDVTAARQLWGKRFKEYPPIDFDLAQYYHHPEQPLSNRPCIAPWLTMQIMPDGTMTFCEDFADLPCGNITREHPLDLWNNSRSREWRRRIRTKGVFSAESRCVAHYLY
jgi:MoaA/NifB/PqqE/SkfB family radical SAM enzyme